MRKVNTNELEPPKWASPKGTLGGEGVQLPTRRPIRSDALDYFDGDE